MKLTAVIFALLIAACTSSETVPGTDLGVDSGADAAEPDLGGSNCPEVLDTSAPVSGTGPCTFEAVLPEDTITEFFGVDVDVLELGEETSDEPGWLPARVRPGGAYELSVDSPGPWELTLVDHGAPVEVERERSLVWTQPELIGTDGAVSFAQLMQAAAGNDDPGLLLEHWFARFARTSHSERVGPAQFLDEWRSAQGDDPTQWDLDALDFAVTGVHNRLDLAAENSCGEFRVSVASTHPTFQPFHAIFLFDQLPAAEDRSPAGTLHCAATARRWARLTTLPDDEFVAAARALVDEAVQHDRFIMIETVEFIISPWEWRQWVPQASSTGELARVLDNPTLFQTVSTERVNADGPARDAFLDFVRENAAELNARTTILPEQFRSASVRVNAGVPWVPIDIGNVAPEFPNLRQNIEMTGCPACHATDAEFIHTRPDGTFSPFYDKELDARADYLEAHQRGEAPPVPFGPLQADFVLPP